MMLTGKRHLHFSPKYHISYKDTQSFTIHRLAKHIHTPDTLSHGQIMRVLL